MMALILGQRSVDVSLAVCARNIFWRLDQAIYARVRERPIHISKQSRGERARENHRIAFARVEFMIKVHDVFRGSRLQEFTKQTLLGGNSVFW